MNRFVFIIPFRNVATFLPECAFSLIMQSYKNWIAIFIDDCSTDNSSDVIPKDDRITIIKNQTRVTALPNIHNGIMCGTLQDEDIICILDGDDRLYDVNSLESINQLYQSNDPLLTYGQYVTSYGYMGHCAPYTPESFLKLRTGGYWASHLRTFKFKLYKEMMSQDPDLNCYKNSSGEFYTTCYDIAIMTPLMEIAGFDRIAFNPKVVYVYRLHSQNDHVVAGNLQKLDEKEIFSKTPFIKKDF